MAANTEAIKSRISRFAIWTLLLGLIALACGGALALIRYKSGNLPAIRLSGVVIGMAVFLGGFFASRRIDESLGLLRGKPLALLGSLLALAGAAAFYYLPFIPPPAEEVVRHLETVKADMDRLIAVIERYKEDHKEYPESKINSEFSAFRRMAEHETAMRAQPTFAIPDGSGNRTLTTPVAYISSFPPDPFAFAPGATYCYHAVKEPQPIWFLWSPGPDGRYEFTIRGFEQLNFAEPLPPFIKEFIYDPTNGTISPGDIVRVSAGLNLQ